MDLLIVDVLNYTRTLGGDILSVPVDMDRLVRDIIAVYPDWHPPKADIEIVGSLPRVIGHEGFLTQCVSNLLSNAVKFVPKGVTPQVRIWADDPAPASAQPSYADVGVGGSGIYSDGVIRVWFQDNGIGIAPGDRSRIFRMFGRINPSAQFEGTGIGLTIVRKAMQRMGGRVDFESEPGKGTKFWIELKRHVPTATQNDPFGG